MLRPKKADQKLVEKPKATAKRRKDKEDDDLEEFEEKPEKKLKVEGQNNRKAKICILRYFNEISPGDTFAEIHTFKDLASVLVLKDGIIESF